MLPHNNVLFIFEMASPKILKSFISLLYLVQDGFRYFTAGAMFVMLNVPGNPLIKRCIFWHTMGKMPFPIQFHSCKVGFCFYV